MWLLGVEFTGNSEKYIHCRGDKSLGIITIYVNTISCPYFHNARVMLKTVRSNKENPENKKNPKYRDALFETVKNTTI